VDANVDVDIAKIEDGVDVDANVDVLTTIEDLW